MNLTWHIFKKDFVRLRVALGLWVVMLGVEILLNWHIFSTGEGDAQLYDTVQKYMGLFVTMLRVAMFLLVASLVLDDPLSGTKKMFWVTRPISGGRLLRAKLLGIVLLFGVAPFVVKLPWWLYCGFGWKDLGLMAVIETATLIMIAVPAVTLASFSGQISRFLLYSLVLLAAVMVSILLASAYRVGVDPDLSGSRFLSSLSLSLIGGILVSVWLYLTRRFVIATVFTAGAAGVALLCLYGWPWPLDAMWPENKKQLIGTEQISVEIVNASISRPKDSNPLKLTPSVDFYLKFKNVPADLVTLTGRATVELRWPDGTSIRQERAALFWVSDATLREDVAVVQILRLPARVVDAETATKGSEMRAAAISKLEKLHIRNAGAQVALSVFLMRGNIPVTPEIAARIESEPPNFTVSAGLEVGRPEVLLEMPIKERTEQAGLGLRMHVLGMENGQSAREDPDARWNHWVNLRMVYAAAPSTSLPSVYTVDREHGVVNRIEGSRNSFILPYLAASARVERVEGQIYIPKLWRTDKWIDDPNWLSTRSLVVVTTRHLGGFNREMQTDRLKIKTDKTP